MSVGEFAIEEMLHAYKVLGVSTDLSSAAVKQAYRRMVKRWHPDLYPSGTPAHAEAVQMSKLINEAYSTIARAPLRYYSGPSVNHCEPFKARAATDTPKQRAGLDPIRPLNTDRIEYWVRFFCGLVTGAFLCLDATFSFLLYDLIAENWTVILIVWSVVMLAFAVGAARYGDRFWQRRLKRWYSWG